MGTDCFCKRAQINEEQKTQVDYYEHKNEEILYKLKINLNEDAYTNINYISKEDFYKLVKLFPDSEELISELIKECTKIFNDIKKKNNSEINKFLDSCLNNIRHFPLKTKEDS